MPIVAISANKIQRLTAVVREARWITYDLLMLCGFASTVGTILFFGVYVVWVTDWFASNGGDHLAGNFINYYAAAQAAASGRAPLIYNREWFRAFEAITIDYPGLRFYSYPPIAILLSLPLVAFSYVQAMILWTLLGMGLCFVQLKKLIGSLPAALAVIGAPAASLNIFEGQNGHYSAALLGGGLMLLDRRPVLGGICLACLSYKPHLGILLPFALAAGKQWRAFVAASVTVIGLTLLSVLLFHTSTWTGFFIQMAHQKDVLELGGIGALDYLPSAFLAARELGATIAGAYVVQIISGVGAVAAVIFVWRRPAGIEIQAATLAVATLLATPYSAGYDATILIFAAAWLVREGMQNGFLPWERLAIVGFLLLTPLRYGLVMVPLAPVVLWLILTVLIRHALIVPARISPQQEALA